MVLPQLSRRHAMPEPQRAGPWPWARVIASERLCPKSNQDFSCSSPGMPRLAMSRRMIFCVPSSGPVSTITQQSTCGATASISS
jgi:hypothetical protein